MVLDINFKTGDIVKVYQKMNEGKRERVIAFSGLVIKLRGKDQNQMITVRQSIDGVFVDRIIPLMLPDLVKIEVTRNAKNVRGNLPRKASFEKFVTHRMFKS